MVRVRQLFPLPKVSNLFTIYPRNPGLKTHVEFLHRSCHYCLVSHLCSCGYDTQKLQLLTQPRHYPFLPRVRSPVGPTTRANCSVVYLIGLPFSGNFGIILNAGLLVAMHMHNPSRMSAFSQRVLVHNVNVNNVSVNCNLPMLSPN